MNERINIMRLRIAIITLIVSLSASFSYAQAPTVQSVTPNVVCANATLNITGINLTGVLNARITGGVIISHTEEYSTMLKVVLPATIADDFTIDITTNDGTVTTPTITKFLGPVTGPTSLKTPTVTGSTTVCEGDALNLSIEDPDNNTGVTFEWTFASASNITGASNGQASSINDQIQINDNVGSVVVTYSVVSKFISSCGVIVESTPKLVNVTVNTKPNVTFQQGNIIVCGNEQLSIPLTVLPVGGNPTWQLKEDVTDITFSVKSGSGDVNATVQNASSVSKSVIIVVTPPAGSGNCQGRAREISVIIRPPYTAPTLKDPVVTGDTEICQGSSLDLSISDPDSIPEISFSWTAVGTDVSGISTIGSGNKITDNLTYNGTNQVGTVTYTVTSTLTNPCGGTDSVKSKVVTVNVYKTPTVTLSSQNIQVCSGNNISLSFTISDNASIEWKLKQTVSDISLANTTGTGNINERVTSTATQDKTVIFVVKPKNGPCEGSEIEVPVVISPPYTAPALKLPELSNINGNVLSVCSGETLNLDITDPDGNADVTFRWSGVGTDVNGLSVSSTNNTIDDTLTYTGSSLSANVTYTITSTLLNPCDGSMQTESKTITVTVLKNPSIDPPKTTITVCDNTNLNIAFDTTDTSEIAWKLKNAVTGLVLGITQGTGNIDTTVQYSKSTDTSFIIVATPKNGGCVGQDVEINVDLKVPPVLQMPNITGSLSICNGETLDLKISDTDNNSVTFLWTASGSSSVSGFNDDSGNSIKDTLTLTGTQQVATVDYVVTSILPNPCGGNNLRATRTVTVTVNNPPTVTVPSGSITVNSGDQVQINLTTAPATANAKWKLKNMVSGISLSNDTGTGNIDETITNTNSTNQQVIFEITPIIGGCEGTPVEKTITVRAPITGPVLQDPVVNGDLTICSGETLALEIKDPNNNANVTFSWTATSNNVSGVTATGNSSDITDTLVTTGTTVGSAVYTITATLINGLGTQTKTITTTVTVNRLPSITVTNEITVCSGENINISFNTAANTNVNWKLKQSVVDVVLSPSMGTGNINNVVTNNSAASKDIFIVVTPVNTMTNCSGVAKEIKVNVIAPLQPPVIIGSTQICSGSKLDLKLSDPNPETSFSWTVIQSRNITGAIDSTGSTLDDILTLNDGFTSGTVKYRVTSTLSRICSSTQIVNKEIEIKINKKPEVNDVPSEIIVCSGNTISVPLTSSQGATVEWELARVNPKFRLDENTGVGDISVNYTPLQQFTKVESLIFSVKAVNNNNPICSTSDSVSFIVKLVPALRRPDISGSVQVCNNTSTNLVISNPDGDSAISFSWTVVNSINVSGAKSSKSGYVISDRLVRTSNTGTASVTYRVVPFFGDCTGVPKEETVNIIPPPTIGYLSTSQTTVVNGEANICVNDPFNVFMASSASSGITFDWSVSSRTPGISGIKLSGTTNEISESSITHTLSTVQTVIYSIIISNRGCAGVPASLKLNIHPQASIGFVNFKDTVCSGEQLSFSTRLQNGLQNWALKIEPVAVPGSTVSGQNQNSNFTGTVGDVLINATPTQQKVVYKITALAPNNACSNVVLEKEVIVLPEGNFDIMSPTNVCPSDRTLPLRIGNLVNINASTVKWRNIDPFLVGDDPKIKQDATTGDYYYDVFSSEAAPSKTVRLRALVKTQQGSCVDVFKDFSFTIEAIPQMSLANFDENTVFSNKSENFRLQLLGGVSANTTFSVDIPSTLSNGFLVPTAVSNETVVKVTATYTNPTTNCKAYKDFSIKIFKVPDVAIRNTRLSYCASDTTIPRLIGSPAVNDVSSNGRKIVLAKWSGQGVLNPNNPSLTTINLASLAVGTNTVTYTVTDTDNITNSVTKDFVINPLPQPANFTASVICGSSIQFTDNTGFVPGKNEIVDWEWEFGDGTKSTVQNPVHKYSSAGSYSVSLIVTTTHGCKTSTRRSINIQPFIDPDFTWSGLCNNSKIKFIDKSKNVSENAIYTWNFGDGTIITGNSSEERYKNPEHTYSTFGKYNVTFSIGNTSCLTNKTYTLSVLRVITPNLANGYSESFENSDGGWTPGKPNESTSSWNHGIPRASVIDNTPYGARVWSTNSNGEYNVGERSWLTSPCFNLNSLSITELSMYIYSNTPEKVAGAMFEVSYDKGVSWQLLGSSTTKNAFNWYDNSAIAGNLYSVNVNSNLAREGWSGEFSNWKHVIYDLETEFKERSVIDKQIVLRLVFASPNGQPVRGYNGFAIDNISIKNKQEKILVENFINLNDVDDRRNELAFNSTYSDFINKIVNVNYHINTIGNDKFNIDNPEPVATRRLFYGLAQGKYIVINGKVIDAEKSTTDNIKDELIKAGFNTKKIQLVSSIKKNTPLNNYEIQIDMNVIDFINYNTFANGYALYCIITQPQVSGLPGEANRNNESVYYNVMKEMLPNAGGTKLELDTSNGKFNTVNLKYYPKNIYDKNEIEIILVIQNIESKAIELVDNYTYKNVQNVDFSVLAAENKKLFEEINVFPIPFSNNLKITLPPSMNDNNDVKIQFIGSQGKHYYLPQQLQSNALNINTSNLPKGVYTLHIYGDNHNYYKKIVKLEGN